MIRGAAGALVAAVGLCVTAGCAVGGDDDEAGQLLTVFAAASLSGAFTELAEDFETANPGVRVRLSFDGSSGLVDQLAGGAPADVFASADETTMDRATSDGLISGSPTVLATNVLTLVTPSGNPAGITGLDASLDGPRLVVCADGVPCGNATRALAEQTGIDMNPVSEESKVSDVLGKVSSGEADAGLVYTTDARAAGEAVEQIDIPLPQSDANRYPIAVLAEAGDPDLARRFIEVAAGPEGQAVLAGHGFGPP